MKAYLRHVEGHTIIAKSDSNHWVPLDSVKMVGGHEAGTKPMEMVLIALGACTSMDVLSILKKMREDVRNYDLTFDMSRIGFETAENIIVSTTNRMLAEMNE